MVGGEELRVSIVLNVAGDIAEGIVDDVVDMGELRSLISGRNVVRIDRGPERAGVVGDEDPQRVILIIVRHAVEDFILVVGGLLDQSSPGIVVGIHDILIMLRGRVAGIGQHIGIHRGPARANVIGCHVHITSGPVRTISTNT